MEACTLSDNLKYLAENGVTLSIDERMHLELALVQLQEKLSKSSNSGENYQVLRMTTSWPLV